MFSTAILGVLVFALVSALASTAMLRLILQRPTRIVSIDAKKLLTSMRLALVVASRRVVFASGCLLRFRLSFYVDASIPLFLLPFLAFGYCWMNVFILEVDAFDIDFFVVFVFALSVSLFLLFSLLPFLRSCPLGLFSFR